MFTHSMLRPFILCALLALVFFATCFEIYAQQPKQERFTVKMEVVDSITSQPLRFRCDVCMFYEETGSYIQVHEEYGVGKLELSCPGRPKQKEIRLVIIPINRDGSEQAQFIPADFILQVPDTALSPCTIAPVRIKRVTSRLLDEVTVTASQILMYHKGDTLVYNAAALMLSHGSMLDALLEQLPGVEIDGNGVIKSNGRYVEQLLLNGRDLFNGNNEVALQNLPAYAVDNVKIYNKRGRRSELAGRNMGDTKLVMDVRLKKEFWSGLLSNLEAGMGTEETYLAKLFAMLFSEDLSFTAYANNNNLNDGKLPDKKGDMWKVGAARPNRERFLKAGVTYGLYSSTDRWELTGDVKTDIFRSETDKTTMRETFGDISSTYSKHWINNLSRNMTLSTSHKFFAKLGDIATLEVRPKFSYSRKRRNETEMGVTSREFIDYTPDEVLDLLDRSNPNDGVWLNAMLRDFNSSQDGRKASLDAELNIRLSQGLRPSMLSITAGASYDNNPLDAYNRYAVSYRDTLLPSSYTHLYNPWRPQNSYSFNAGADLSTFIGSIEVPVEYKFSYSRNNSFRGAYDLMTDVPVTSLEVGRNTKWLSHVIKVNPKLLNNFGVGGGCKVYANPILMASYIDHSLDFWVADSAAFHRRHELLPEVGFNFGIWKFGPGVWQVNGTLTYGQDPANLDALAADPSLSPLETTTVVSELERPDWIKLSLYLQLPRSSALRHWADLGFQKTRKIPYTLYRVDDQTGQTIIQPYFMNYDAFSFIMYGVSLTLPKQFIFGSETNFDARFSNSQYQGHTDQYYLSETLNLRWTGKWISGDLHGGLRINSQRYKSGQYSSSLLYRWVAGTSGVCKLPYEWNITATADIYRHGGSDFAAVNKVRCLWNMSVQKAFCNGQLVVAVDAYDILHDNIDTGLSLTAYARTESLSQARPGYVLAHVMWRLNQSLRKHKPRQD